MSHSYQTADIESRYRLLFSSFGPEGSGKTHLGFNAPGPVFAQQFDPRGHEGLMRNFKGKDIKIASYKFNPMAIPQEDRHKIAEDLKGQFIEDYRYALKNGRTVQWDKEDYVWEMMRYASFGDNTDKPSNYYELNMEYRGLIQEALDAGVNLQLIRGMKEEWGLVNGKLSTTGRMQQRGMKEVPELVQACLEHWWADGKFWIRVHKCKQNAALRGKVYENADFMTLALDIFPETGATPEVWL